MDDKVPELVTKTTIATSTFFAHLIGWAIALGIIAALLLTVLAPVLSLFISHK